MKIIKVKIKQNPYNIYIEEDIFLKITKFLERLSLGNFALIITSESVFRYYKKQIKKAFNNFNHQIIVLPDGEEAKSKKELFKIVDTLVKIDKINRKIFIACIGGGTIGDVGGFAAAIYKRGVAYIQIPTTLLAQIDASIGGKTAIDLKEAKNILGTFYQPKAVFIDPGFLNTLNKTAIKEGLAEVIKYAVIKDKNFFNFLKNDYKKIISLSHPAVFRILTTCIGIKAKIVGDDEKEKKGIRTILNFGHTFAHGLEAASKYKKISHGQAVSLGMLYAAYISCKLGYCSMNEVNNIRDILSRFELTADSEFKYESVYRAMSYDKKNIYGSFRLVLLRKIGEVAVRDGINKNVIINSLRNFNAFI